MRTYGKFTIHAILGLCLTLTLACKKKKMDEISPGTVETVQDKQTPASDTIGKGTFISYEHGLAGNALLYNEKTGGKILRLTGFNMTPGPNVYVYLSKTSSYSSSNTIAITRLTTGYSNSNLNFAVPESYSSEYKYVLVYCIQFNSLFGYAELKQP